MPYAEVGGVRLNYERAGRGAPELVFIPGWCCDHTAFQPQFDHFARTHGVTSLDLRGCGESDAPEGGYSIPQLADDVVAVCGAAGIERPVLVGHSLGGMIAVELAARCPSFATRSSSSTRGQSTRYQRLLSSFAASRTSFPGRTAR